MSILDDSSAGAFFEHFGMMRGIRMTLLLVGSKRFGPPGESTVAVLKEIRDLPRLERMSERLLDVASWDELLAIS